MEGSSERLTLLEPQCGGCVAGHSPVSSWTERTTSHLGSVGQATPLELLGEESATEGGEPFLDYVVCIDSIESLSGQEEYLAWAESPTQQIIGKKSCRS